MFLNKNGFGPQTLQAGPAHFWKVNQTAKCFDWRWEDLCLCFGFITNIFIGKPSQVGASPGTMTKSHQVFFVNWLYTIFYYNLFIYGIWMNVWREKMSKKLQPKDEWRTYKIIASAYCIPVTSFLSLIYFVVVVNLQPTQLSSEFLKAANTQTHVCATFSTNCAKF